MFIQMQDVVKRYGAGENTTYALDHASLGLGQGEICVVLGPSGAERTQRNIRKSHCKAIPNQSIIPTNL